MTGESTTFDARLAPCGAMHGGERFSTDDLLGLATEEVRFTCGCRNAREEFHDGSVHLRVVRHDGRILVDEEFRGE